RSALLPSLERPADPRTFWTSRDHRRDHHRRRALVAGPVAEQALHAAYLSRYTSVVTRNAQPFVTELHSQRAWRPESLCIVPVHESMIDEMLALLLGALMASQSAAQTQAPGR